MYKNRFNYIILSFLASLFIGNAAFGQTPIQQHPKLIKNKLQNGLTYYIYPNQFPRGEAVYRLFIKSGSINETDEQRGLAHFLEHMAFNGTRNFPENSLVQFLESKGAKFGHDLNAHTSYTETVYKLQLPSGTTGIVDTALTILSDWLSGITLSERQIDAERGVIMSEWFSKLTPEAELNDLLLNKLMNESRYAERKVIGDTAVIKNFEYRLLRDYYTQWYQPGLAAIAVSGDINPEEVEKMIIEKFSRIPVQKHNSANYEIPNYTDREAITYVNKALKKNELVSLQLIPPSAPVRTENDYPPYLERTMLNRLFRNRLNSLSFNNTSYKNAGVGLSDFLNAKGVVMASVELIPEKEEEGISKFLQALKQIYQYAFIPIEIDKVKKAYLSQMERRAKSESPVTSSSLMDEIYADFFKGYTVISPEEELRLLKKYINRIDSASIAHFLQQAVHEDFTHYLYSSFDSTNISQPEALLSFIDSVQKRPVSPYKLEIDVPATLLSKEPRSGKIMETKDIQEINATELILSNGVRVIYRPSISSGNRINISAFKKGGLYALDSADYAAGVFSGSVVSLSGAGDFTRDALSYYLAGNSASVSLLVEKTRSGLVGSASLEDIETLFRLLYKKWTEPNVNEEVFVQVKNRAIENYQKQNRTAETDFYRDLGYLLRGKDYVTREMTDTVIKEEVVLEKILPIFKQSFADASGYTFVIVSTAPLEDLYPYIEGYLAALPSDKKSNLADFNYGGGNIRTSNTDFVRETGESPRAVVSLIFQQTHIPGNIDDYTLLSEISANILRMKLLQTLREDMGMVYSVSVSTGATMQPSPLVRSTINFTCLPENVDTLLGSIQSILNLIKDNPSVISVELENVKANQLKTHELNIQRDSYWSTFIRNTSFNELYNWRYISDFIEKVDGIATKEVAETLSLNFNKKNMIKAVLLPK